MRRLYLILFPLLLLSASLQAQKTHDILFCGERIPVSNDFVAKKLMNVIRQQIPNVNLPALRQRSLQNFPYIESYLRSRNLPLDFKYLPIVESGFLLQSSKVGARGFWQLMRATALGQGLIVNDQLDERDDLVKATTAACNELIGNFNLIQKVHKLSSWVLTAAAYNFGIGRIFKAIKAQGSDYFAMDLNPETATYVYKIIAVKELFEYPELYMKSFGYNVFSASAKPKSSNKPAADNTAIFDKMEVKVSKNETAKKPADDEKPPIYVAAHIVGKYNNFQDGDMVEVELEENLVVKGGFTRKKMVIKDNGWVIDNRVVVDMGYGHEVILCDASGKKGIDLVDLKKTKNLPVLLKNTISDAELW